MASSLHTMVVMRLFSLLAVATVLTTTLFACSDADTGATLKRGARRTPPAAGTPDDHSTDPGDDENTSDDGNPNANTPPDAPGTPGTSAPQFALGVSTNIPTVGLGESVDIDVTVEPKNGFTGNVDLSVSGLPPGASAAPVQAIVAAGAVAAAPVKLTIKADFTAIPSPAGGMSPLAITGKSGAITATANANMKIAPKVKLTIPVNIDALRAASVQYRDQWGAPFGASQTPLKTQTGNGIVVTVFNADSKNHIIHGQGGFSHGSTTAGNEIKPNSFEMLNGAVRTRTLNPGVNASGYPHEGGNGSGASFRIAVTATN